MPLFISLYAVSGFVTRICSKLCSATMSGESKTSYGYYYVTHSLIACIFFIISGGFSISVNLPTLLYSVALGASILVNMLVSIFVLRYMNILGAGILTTPVSLLVIALSGNLFFGEEIGLSVYLKILVTTVSALCIFADIRLLDKKSNKDTERKSHVDLKRALPLMFISVILGASQTLIMKSFAISKSVTNEHSFYLLTNVVILIWGIILLLSSVISEHGNFRNGLSFFKPKRVLSSVGNVVSSNINSLVTMPIMAAVNISLFSPLSSAYGIVANVLVSLLFKEKLGIYSYIGTAIAILAIFI